MSKNRNRKKFDKALTSREYTLKLMKETYSYCYICQKRSGSWYYDCSPADMHCKHRHGNGRKILPYKYRSYKSWKHNRKTKSKIREKAKEKIGDINSQFGTCWITNGSSNMKINKNESIPEGWSLGRKIKLHPFV